SRPIEGFETEVVGVTTTPEGGGYEATAGSDVVVITAGLPRKPGMSRMDLLEVNAKIVRGVAENIAAHSPEAVLVVVSNPLDELVTRTRNGGAEVVALLKTGSAYYAPSAAAARMARAVIEDSHITLPVCAWVDGEYGISGVYLGVEAELGAGGVARVVERDLTGAELSGLKEAAEAVRAKQADVANL